MARNPENYKKWYESVGREQMRVNSNNWRKKNPEKALALTRRNNTRLKAKGYYKDYRMNKRVVVIKYYSEGSMSCKCCGEKQYKFLAIDHINGGGRKHLIDIGRDINTWLIKNNFPEGFQVLCHNCNMAKGLYGACPHKDI